MRTVPLAEAKNRLSFLVLSVELGEEIAITRRGRVVAHLVRPDAPRTTQQEEVSSIFEELRALSSGVHLEGDLKTIACTGLD
ncbi:MAG: type II toxin-antitoxin system prevent-host-death family antitoxin [Azoarcus sp.]|jgi:antitoxin (DNA-binding transcriptional repressor) of toxin-antitoxin stability system|nr:type II toxin-antitoxin system prevent-host-death family antitoxin [Azoarcus sp.]